MELGLTNWGQRLGTCVGRRIRLPAGLVFEGPRDTLVLRLGVAALNGNMQQDAAAFEAWALAFMVHCGVEQIELHLPQHSPGEGGERHWRRLLYRLSRFLELFPERVSVHPADRAHWRPAGADALWLNQPLSHRRPAADHASLMRIARGSHAESDLEFALEVSPVLQSRFGLQKIMRQWPVGVFNGSVAAENHLFTGGKSAIDLVGIRDKTLVLIELKKGGNARVGILSELLFYSSVMRDALGPEPSFAFAPTTQPRHCLIGPADIRGCDRIEAVLLAPSFHPLVTAPVVALLNDALASHWPDRPIHFEGVRFEVGQSDFELRAGWS